MGSDVPESRKSPLPIRFALYGKITKQQTAKSHAKPQRRKGLGRRTPQNEEQLQREENRHQGASDSVLFDARVGFVLSGGRQKKKMPKPSVNKPVITSAMSTAVKQRRCIVNWFLLLTVGSGFKVFESLLFLGE
jgi:hypothetical protein